MVGAETDPVVPADVVSAFLAAFNVFPKGAPRDLVRRWTRAALGRDAPDELLRWLAFCNGARHKRGALLGFDEGCSRGTVQSLLRLLPLWVESGWVPIANDGCGCYFVLDVSEGFLPAVYFVDNEDYDTLAYVVASDLWHFLFFLLRDWTTESDEPGPWPFKADNVLQDDPGLGLNTWRAPLPWEA